jgi:hypothetical protein
MYKIMILNVKNFIVFSLALISLASCTKEGPQGPEGAPGPAGAPGQPGPAGPQGQTGNANVFYSDWITINLRPTSEPDIFVQEIKSTSLTADVVNTGVVLMYYQYADFVYPLPLKPMWFNYEAGRILLLSEDNSPNGNKVRFVAMPGSQKVGNNAAELNKEALEKLSYNQITKSMAIPASGTNIP